MHILISFEYTKSSPTTYFLFIFDYIQVLSLKYIYTEAKNKNNKNKIATSFFAS